MDYKYQRRQIFGKRLKVPKNILNKVYNRTLSFNEFIEYELDDKIPILCIIESDRKIIEKFGIEKCKLINDFNGGKVGLKEIVFNWDLFKDKDLSFCLLNDKANKNHITDSILKEFMSNYGSLASLIIENNDIYTFINTISALTLEEKKEYVKQFTDDILSNTYKKNSDRPLVKPTDEEYREIFNYSSMYDYLITITATIYYEKVINVINELKTLPQDYVFNMSIPFSELLNENLLVFIGTYGLKNIIDFDNECGHFFTKNNCKMLKLMYGNEYESYRRYDHYKRKNPYENRMYRPYTKDEFYEAMRGMIVMWPATLDYKEITGEFRVRYAELFISEQAPEELQKLFYTKAITPQLLLQHPEYVDYLNGKDLRSCIKGGLSKVIVKDSNDFEINENFYNFIGRKTDFNGVISFITEYSDILDIVLNEWIRIFHEIRFSINDDMNQIQNRIHKSLRDIIVEKELTYPTHIPKNMIDRCPSMFLDKNAPQELQKAFYSRTLSSTFILSNPSYREFLKNVDLEIVFKYMPVDSMFKNSSNEIVSSALGHRTINTKINFVNALKQTFGEQDALDVMLSYGKYIEQVFEANHLKNFLYNPEFSQDDFLEELDKISLQNIIDGNMKYDESIHSHFKNNNPTLFLDPSVSQKIKNKFYNREFTLKDFNDNPELFNIFDNTNIACGFSENMSWIIPLFSDSVSLKAANYNRMKVILAYSKIQDVDLQKEFKNYVMEFDTNIDVDKIESVSEILSKLYLSNSSEIDIFRKEIANQILKSKNPLESLNKIEDIFIRNNIPTVGKIYSCFEILHPDFKGFNFDSSMISPVLKYSSTTSKKIIVFSDLIKASFGSNNRSVNAYLRNIEIGSNLYESLKSGQIQYNTLSEIDQKELITFSRHLATLYNNTLKVKQEEEAFKVTGNVLTDILELSKKLSPDGTLEYNLGNRVIRMFCGFTGIDSLEQAKEYISKKIQTADSRNRKAAKTEMVLEQGDFIKGIGDITYLRNILQNGSVSKEYLGASACTDTTPLDTDVSMVMSSEGTIRDKWGATKASFFGPIWFVLKNDDRFVITRNNSETLDVIRDMSKMEAFYTGDVGVEHYGIRTGFASSEINYIVIENYDPRVGLEIAMNGFYIPVANKEGKIVFTPDDYDKLREKMSGLSYYDEENYLFSENLVTEEIEYLVEQIEPSNYEVQVKKAKINELIKSSLNELGLHLKTTVDGDLTEGFVELIDTGSTGRGTNKPGDGDFDFMMRLDAKILSSSSKLNELKQNLLRNLGRENSSELTGAGDFRLKNIQIDADTSVDIDITFTKRTDKIAYSTDMALQDRLATIKKINPEKYKYVVANILLAKSVLKEAKAYKPNRGEIPQGGLGGVGIENWILQNGGSFIDAARRFIAASEGKSFSEFQSSYQIWDFGDNYLAERRERYPHDNFVSNNMSESGYQRMVRALKKYLKSMEMSQIQTEGIKR